jgi:hypothetical protein
LAGSRFAGALNEKQLGPKVFVADLPKVDLPEEIRFEIIPEEVLADRRHPDIRIARRAQTIANLSRHISERNVSDGLRRVLELQARRLQFLTSSRTASLHIATGALLDSPEVNDAVTQV